MSSRKILVALALFFTATMSAFSVETQTPATEAVSAVPTSLSESGLPKTWLQGTPVSKWEKDKVYVFEFWATWCGPCLAAIPHLESIHKEITRDNVPAQLVGVNIKDRASPKILKNFLARRSTPPTYTIAVDTEKTSETHWLTPLKVVGIPFAVAVKNGKILWKGHPAKLSASHIKAMTKPDFSPEITLSPRERIAKAEQQVRTISRLFSKGETEAAEAELKSLLEDKNAPESQKINALETPAFLALNRGDFRKMNAALRRLAETFPQSYRCQIRVINFVQTTDDVPESERDFALAIECLNRALGLVGDMPSQRSFIYSRLAEAYSAQGNDAEAMLAAQNAWTLSPECTRLERLRQKLECAPKNEEALELFDDLLSGKKSVPEEFLSFKKKNSPAPARDAFPRKSSNTPEAAALLEFLKSLEWAQGTCPESLPENGVLFVDFWTPPPPGPHAAFLSRKPALWLDEKLSGEPETKTIVIAISDKPERVKKTLTFRRNQTLHAVAVLSETGSEKILSEKFNVRELPAATAFRDGKIIWSGSAQDLPEWLADDAVKPDYNHELAEARRAEANKNFLKISKEISEIQGLVRQSKFDEARERIEAIRAEAERHPFLDMRIAELSASKAFSERDFETVGKICEGMLKKYPKLTYVSEYQMKILTADEELRLKNLRVFILACKNMLAAGTPYESAYLGMMADFYAEDNDATNAIYAAFAARDASEKFRAFKTAEARLHGN